MNGCMEAERSELRRHGARSAWSLTVRKIWEGFINK
jgi:hypothetical protein